MDTKDMQLVINENIGKFARLFISEKKLKKAYQALMKEVMETLNKSALEKEIESGIFKTKLFNKAFTLYPAIVSLLQITWDKEHLDKVEEITGYRLSKLEDREIIIEDMKKLQAKYRELTAVTPQEGVSFSQMIVATEIVLEFQISRDIKLYEFQHYMQSASNKIKQLEKK